MTQVSKTGSMPVDLTSMANIPTSVADTVTFASPILPLYSSDSVSNGLVGLGTMLLSFFTDHAVTVTITRYLDQFGLIPNGAGDAHTTTGGFQEQLLSYGGTPAFYWGYTIANASGSTCNITHAGIAAYPNAL